MQFSLPTNAFSLDGFILFNLHCSDSLEAIFESFLKERKIVDVSSGRISSRMVNAILSYEWEIYVYNFVRLEMLNCLLLAAN